MPGYDNNDWQTQMLAAMLMRGQQPDSGAMGGMAPTPLGMATPSQAGMGGMGQSGWTPPVTPAGQSFLANNAGGGMFGPPPPSPYTSIDPHAPAGSPGAPNAAQDPTNPFILAQAQAGKYFPSYFDGGGGGAESGR